MRLLYLIDIITNSGGMERIVIDKINYLADIKHVEVFLAYYGSEDDVPYFPISEKVSRIPIPLKYRKLSYKEKICLLIELKKQLNQIINNCKPDIIINLDMYMVRWLLPFCYRSIPKIIELHFSYDGLLIMNDDINSKGSYKNTLNMFLRKSIYPRYDKCVLLSSCDKTKWGFKNIVVIPNFTNLTITEVGCIKKHPQTVINIGRLSLQKNQSLLIDAWKIVHQEEPSWILEIWGDGVLREMLEKKIISEGLSECVFLKGASNNIKEVYEYASFFVLSSKYEGLPLVLIEAMQCGLPCVSVPIDGTREIVKDGENGFLVENVSAKALAGGIVKMIRSEQYAKMSKNAVESVKAFDKEIIMEKWCTLFKNLIRKE